MSIVRAVVFFIISFRCNPSNYLESNMLLAHVGKGLYALQLERWFAMFGRENIKVTGRM